MQSSKSFILLHFIFKSVVNFELIFVQDVRSCLDSFFYKGKSSFSGTFCWKFYLFSIVLSLHLCQKSVDYVCMGLLSVSLICTFFHQYHTLDYESFVVVLKLNSSLSFSFSIMVAIRDLLLLHIKGLHYTLFNWNKAFASSYISHSK